MEEAVSETASVAHAAECIVGGIDAAGLERHRRRRRPLEKPAEQRDAIGDVDAAVVVDVLGVRASDADASGRLAEDPEQAVEDGDRVRVASDVGNGEMKAKVTDLIHPEAVFMLHGFGHEAKAAERSYGKGVADAALQENLMDKIGGSPALHDTFITVEPMVA